MSSVMGPPEGYCLLLSFFFSSRRRHTRFDCDWSSDVCSSDLTAHTFPDCYRGRWLTMDAADLDGDGDVDIVLGGVYKTPFRAPERLLERWQKERSEERRVGKECRSRWSPYH